MIISRITDTDIPAVLDALLSAYRYEFWNEDWTKERAFIRIRAILCNYKAAGLKDNNEKGIVRAILGFSGSYSNKNFFYILELFVEPERKGQGMGTALLNSLDKYLKANNIHAIQLISI